MAGRQKPDRCSQFLSQATLRFHRASLPYPAALSNPEAVGQVGLAVGSLRRTQTHLYPLKISLCPKKSFPLAVTEISHKLYSDVDSPLPGSRDLFNS